MTDVTEKSEQRSDSTTRFLYGVIGVLIVGIIAVGLYILFSQITAPDDTANNDGFTIVEESDFDGSTAITPPRPMSDFTLTNQNGEDTSLSDLRGQYVLITFGYTHCPDVCPLTLNEMRRIQDSLGDLADQVEFVFISVDGRRDTPESIKTYFETRNLDGFIGLTGDSVTLDKLGVDFGLFYELGEPDSTGSYLVDHTAGTYLLNPDGEWIMRYQFGVMPSLIVDDLETFMRA